MNKLEIKLCPDIEELREECLRQYSALFYISETCVEESKKNIKPSHAIEKIRAYLRKWTNES